MTAEQRAKKYARNKEWSSRNRDKVLAYHRMRRERDKVKMARQKRAWYYRNRERALARVKAYMTTRMNTDVGYRMRRRISTRICNAVRGFAGKCSSTPDLIGCSIDRLKEHLASKFSPGMSFKNYGKWEIDHVVPCAKFNLALESEQRACFHYTNLQPLWKVDNLSKRRSDGVYPYNK